MKLTNKYGLPDVFVRAVQNDKYSRDGADYSATDLINSPRIVQLKRRHWDEIEEDVSERMWSLIGRSVHSILEQSQQENAIQEERIHAEICGRKISGASDLYQLEWRESIADRLTFGDWIHVISDYKVTSVWTAIYGSRIEEWTVQLNIYAWLYRSIGFDVEKLQVVAIYRDWKASEAARNPEYPQRQAEIVELELWPEEQQSIYLGKRIGEMKTSEKLHDAGLPECSRDEMWERDPKWAVQKEGNQKASRVLDTEEEAKAWISEQKKPTQFRIDFRAPERIRCQSYCPVSKWCNQYQDWREKYGKVEEPE